MIYSNNLIIDLKKRDSEIMFMSEEIIRSPLDHGGFFVSDLVSVVFNVSVLSVAWRHVHGSNIVRVAQTWWESSSNGVEIVRHPSPFGDLNTISFFNERRSDGISHSDSFFLSIFTGCSSVPIPRINIVVKFVSNIDCGDGWDPHTEWTVTVKGVLLEISIHFICA